MNNIQKQSYIINRKKYINLSYLHIGGNNKSTRFTCHPDNKYNDICKEDKKGKYKSKNSCLNDCETQFINNHLIKANIKRETTQFYLFIKNIIKNEKMDVYVKGGNVIGLYILKMIYNKYKNNDYIFKKVFRKFLKLNLLKDWDFVAYTKKDKKGICSEINKSYRKKLDKVANKYGLVSRAGTFILYQTYKPILIEDKAFFEIAVLDSVCFSKMELPMTTMKVKIRLNNLKYIYMLSKLFLSHTLNNEDFDFDILKKIISRINVIVHPHKDGLYIPKNKFDKGGLSSNLISFINKFTKGDKSLSQFLITHLQDPYRMLYRLPEKNIIKTNKIRKFIKREVTKHRQSWLIQTDKIVKTIKEFTKKLGNKLLDIYIKGSIDDVSKFMNGVKFNRTKIEYKNFSDNSIKLLNNILKQLIDKMKKDKIKPEVRDKNDIITFINFFITV
jgi:hypothetical protein